MNPMNLADVLSGPSNTPDHTHRPLLHHLYVLTQKFDLPYGKLHASSQFATLFHRTNLHYLVQHWIILSAGDLADDDPQKPDFAT